ncbi:hypothetical protein [Streptomyces sp. RKAG337]|uniref:hypothetical protein n=1 Tax=Streptomyces sp. RKAG337 TaxID=2893404 RepID=UPI0020340176|nr:hypothetical protein [Streptomyces sp. RKAG337]MCM2430828.1 hypothetical protein [Streptomyces sp. RKAG337]
MAQFDRDETQATPLGTPPTIPAPPASPPGGTPENGSRPPAGPGSLAYIRPSAHPPETPPAPAHGYESAPQQTYAVPDGNLAPLRIPTAPAGVASATDHVRIGLWGAPRSGKTTFLGALPIAAMQHHRHSPDNWVIGGMTPQATEFLNDSVERLTMSRVFPDATVGLEGLSWSFQGQEGPARRFGKTRELGFVLDVQDVMGEAFNRNNPHHAQILDQLAAAKGLIYLFDPLLDGKSGTESLNYFYATLNALNARVRDAGGHHRGRLPHYVSVCVAKFDDPAIFEPAVRAGWVTQDSVGSQIPRVPAEQSAGFFSWLCDEFRGSTARLVRDGLNNFFHPERISYYATSAIGFRLNPQHTFDYRSYLNVESVDGKPRICTSPEPINVLEPLIDLERRIRTDGRKGRLR